jgi:dephospho-CoA kinase
VTATNRTAINLGITGTIGAGKSTVGEILKGFGIPVIDSDQIVHHLLSDDDETKKLVLARFGKDIVLNDDPKGHVKIDRKALGTIVFADATARKDLEVILHPRVRTKCRRLIEELVSQSNPKVVATLVPLLFEAGLQNEYDQIWTVITAEQILKERLSGRDNFSVQEVERRLSLQISQSEKVQQADRVIDNSGDLSNTVKQVKQFLDELVNL